MSRAGDLRLEQRRNDPLLTARTHDRFDQLHKGVRVFGGDVVRHGEVGHAVGAVGADPVPRGHQHGQAAEERRPSDHQQVAA